MATFDVIANNADRKGGHCLLDADGQVWGIDHGLCFHAEPKLRTVIWDFAGEPLARRTGGISSSWPGAGLPADLTALLHDEERRALEARIERILQSGRLPAPRSTTPIPGRWSSRQPTRRPDCWQTEQRAESSARISRRRPSGQAALW